MHLDYNERINFVHDALLDLVSTGRHFSREPFSDAGDLAKRAADFSSTVEGLQQHDASWGLTTSSSARALMFRSAHALLACADILQHVGHATVASLLVTNVTKVQQKLHPAVARAASSLSQETTTKLSIFRWG